MNMTKLSLIEISFIKKNTFATFPLEIIASLIVYKFVELEDICNIPSGPVCFLNCF